MSVRRPKGAWHRFFDVASPLIWPLVLSAYVGVAETAADLALGLVKKRANDTITQEAIGEMRTQLLLAQDSLDRLIAVASADYEPSPALSDLTYRRKTVASKAALRTVELAMEAKEKEQRAPQSKKMHGIFSKLANKHDRCQVKKTIYKAVPSKFGNAIFSWAVFHHFFPKFFEPRPFCEQGNIAVHFTIYFYIFYYFIFVSF